MLFLKTFKDVKFVVDGNAFQTFITLAIWTDMCGIGDAEVATIIVATSYGSLNFFPAPSIRKT